MSKRALAGLADSLRSIVEKLRWKPVGTEWGAYYDCTAYTDEAMAEKRKFVTQFIETIGPKTVWDLGANTGAFSRIASEKGIQTVAFDIDPAAVEKNFLACVEKNEARLLPLVLDLTNPSPPLGWHNRERQPLYERGPADVVLALALIHHLAISNNVPLPMLADFFAGLCHDLIIEFVPKTDPQVQRLLATREDIFPDYSQEGFEAAFAHQFLIEEKRDVTGAGRILYRLKRIEGEPG